MIETMPGGEPIILEKAAKLLYCGECMREMINVGGNLFRCGVCGMNHQKIGV